VPSVFLYLFGLGLAAIDPVGISIMPILLVQERPYARSLFFLSGSFVSLIVMGLLFAMGLGQFVLRLEQQVHWLVPVAEAIAGAILIIVAAYLFFRLRFGKVSVDPSGNTRRWLTMGNGRLFVLGAVLVAVQSVLDVVFVLAMIRVGQFRLSGLTLVSAIATYAFAALLLQAAVVIIFRMAPDRQKDKVLQKVSLALAKYSYQAIIAVSLGIGLLLLASTIIK